MGKFIEGLVIAATLPIFFFNLLATLSGSIWLLILGHWVVVLLFFLISIFVPFFFGIAYMLQVPLVFFAIFLSKKKIMIGFVIFSFIGTLLGHVINLAWVISVFVYIISLAGQLDAPVLPFLLAGWGMAIGPFQYMASREPPDSIGTTVGMLVVQLAYLLLFLSYYVLPVLVSLALIIIITLLFSGYVVMISSSMMGASYENEY